MKILHVIDRLNPGGAERVCIDLANLSCEMGLSVGILVLLNESKLDTSIHSDVSIHYLRRGSKIDIKKYFEVAAISNGYDIIHVHMRHVYRYMVVAKLVGSIKSKLILHDHFGDIHTDKQVPYLFNSLFKPTFYIGVSTELTRWAEHNLKMNPERVFLLANIVRQFRGGADNVELKNGVVLVSNIRRTKNLSFAIQLASVLHLNLDIIGQLVDEEYYYELKEKIKELKLESKIRFIHDCYEVQPLLTNYRVALHTAKSETGPLVLMEYLAQGTNFVAYRTGEVAEALDHFLPFFFMNTFDLNAWVERVNSIMETPVNKTILLSVFQENYSSEKYYDRCLKIYQSILRS